MFSDNFKNFSGNLINTLKKFFIKPRQTWKSATEWCKKNEEQTSFFKFIFFAQIECEKIPEGYVRKKVYSIAEFLFLCCLFLTHDCAAIYRCCLNFFFRSQNICFEFFPQFSVCFFPALFDVWNFFWNKNFFKIPLCLLFQFFSAFKIKFQPFLPLYFVFCVNAR